MQINEASVRIHFPVLTPKVDDLFNSEVPVQYGQTNEQKIDERAIKETHDRPQKDEADPVNRVRTSSKVS